MAFDGFCVAALTAELKNTIIDCHISKIAQPEKDELIFTIKGSCGQKRLLLSSMASLPLVYFTENNKPSPMTAPSFCMLLRKFIANGKIIDISQPSLERIIRFEIEHLDELGDIKRKHLYVELMGKHSNIIFCDDKDVIIDSIKHIPASVSSVREVLPGRDYFIPNTKDKTDPFSVDEETFNDILCKVPKAVGDALCAAFTGFSKAMSSEIVLRAEINSESDFSSLSASDKHACYQEFKSILDKVKSGDFSPVIIMSGSEPVDFSAFELQSYMDINHTSTRYESISLLLETFYSKKNVYTRIRQRSVELRHIVSTAIERDAKKLDLQIKQLKDTEKRDKYKLYGELLLTYGYSIPEGSKKAVVNNYYDNTDIEIPLDETITPIENSKKYYDRYNKLKRTYEALSELTVATNIELEYLKSVSANLDIAVTEDDLVQIREELTVSGFIKNHGTGKKKVSRSKSKPFHYISSDGFDIYVGKNNLQNEELTFKVANANDWWFHAKKVPGSHVIIKSNGTEPTDKTFEEAAALAAYYSKGAEAGKVDIDYVQRKEVKKVAGAAIGYVIYHTNYSMTIAPDISSLTEVFD